ncbi:MAG: sulfotransferase family protein [Gemmatimonadaceae bacterium]
MSHISQAADCSKGGALSCSAVTVDCIIAIMKGSVDMGLDRPIFVVGVGRSGSTVFHHLMTKHPRVAWLSELCERYPSTPWPNQALMRAIDLPLVGPVLVRHVDPGECYRFWEHHVRGFSAPCRDLVAGDVMNSSATRIRKALSGMTTPARPRLLIKITGWPRLSFLDQIFPDALFINVMRDGRAVASSLLNVHFWQGWGGPSRWRWGDLTSEQLEEWERHDRSFVALAGIQWKILMDAMERAKEKIAPARLLELKYEELCKAPVPMFRRVAEFCELDWSESLSQAALSEGLRNENEKWRSDFTPAQQEILTSVLREYLLRYGYE